MAGKLEQVSVALKEGRRELVLKGSDVSEVISKHGLDQRIFQVKLLNFLEISDASLEELGDEIEQLQQLKNLILRGNLLQTIPETLGELSVLRTLDLSRNKIDALPDSIGNLSELYYCDVSGNQLTELPETMSKLEHLTVLDVSNNKLSSLSCVCLPELTHLNELLASQNEIESLDHNIRNLSALKKLDLCNNKLTVIPADLASCSKLKELLLKGNPLKDSRLSKLVKQNHSIKPILENIRTRGEKSTRSVPSEEQGKKKKGKQKKKISSKNDQVDELPKLIIKILHFKESSSGTEVKITESVADVRPYIVCCVVENINLQKGNMFKQFIKLQTKFHDGPLCMKRTVATIATHDMQAIHSPLLYDARLPQLIEIIPLMKTKPVTAAALMSELLKEADEQRKAQKRNTVSGVHKYLDLLSGHERYPCLMNKDGSVISFPPITNADITKIGRDTTSLFIEVTSSKDLASCKAVMDELLRDMLQMEMGEPPAKVAGTSSDSDESSDDEAALRASSQEGAKHLCVRQVKILDENGTMKVVYPSRTDLNYPGIHVIRD
ncbi:Leucine-rich repeat-containing protein 47 [Holothuria leucospilota]|uniref:Leucine-rich repeat-containing protein 47 n=1 Tax=Holothuria leucospilota TaxID=206669 RepID=A0A9Q0YK25_HOLLE|nr:Leucine-rich repeat-containing protein 47 [Holothuria leucospilota]